MSHVSRRRTACLQPLLRVPFGCPRMPPDAAPDAAPVSPRCRPGSGEKYQYVFKGAQSAPNSGWPPHRDSPREATADWHAAEHPPASGWPPRATVSRRAPAAFLWPFGPRRRRRALTPAADPTGNSPRRQQWRAGVPRGRGHPSGARIMKPCKITVKVVRPRCAAGAPP
jgi:hypothetical protein